MTALLWLAEHPAVTLTVCAVLVANALRVRRAEVGERRVRRG